MTEDEKIKADAEDIFEKYFLIRMFMCSQKRLPRKIKKRLMKDGFMKTKIGLRP